MSDTPRTDAAAWTDPDIRRVYVPVEVARQLERELAQANDDIRALLDALAHYAQWRRY